MLAQRLERRPGKLGQLVQKEHAVVRQRHLPWPRIAPTPGKPRGRHRVVRRPEGPTPDERPVALPTRAVDLGYLDALLHGERGENPGHPARQHSLPRPRRSTHNEVVPPCRGHLQSPLGVTLSCYVGKVLVRLESPPILGSRFGRGDPRRVPEKLPRLPERPQSIDLYAADGRGLGRIPLGDKQPRQPLPPGTLGHRKRPPHTPQP